MPSHPPPRATNLAADIWFLQPQAHTFCPNSDLGYDLGSDFNSGLGFGLRFGSRFHAFRVPHSSLVLGRVGVLIFILILILVLISILPSPLRFDALISSGCPFFANFAKG